MAKILTSGELLIILKDIIANRTLLRDKEDYIEFLEAVGKVIGDFLGATAGSAGYDDDLGYSVAFHIHEYTHPDGGEFSLYDTDVVWENGKEYDRNSCPAAVREQIKLLEDQIAHPEKYPELFEGEYSEYLDHESEVRVGSTYYKAIDVLKAVDPCKYKALMQGFILDVLPTRPSSVLEDLRERLEILKEDTGDKTEV